MCVHICMFIYNVQNHAFYSAHAYSVDISGQLSITNRLERGIIYIYIYIYIIIYKYTYIYIYIIYIRGCGGKVVQIQIGRGAGPEARAQSPATSIK